MIGHSDALLSVEDLRVRFTTRHGVVQGVRGVSFEVAKGETLGIVGESGSGKSVTAQAVMGLVNVPGEITGGEIRWKGRSLLDSEGRNFARKVRGKELAIIFQDPMTSLNPLFTVGMQIGEVLRHHLGMSKAEAAKRACELLTLVGINAPERRLTQYPHEFSGGMRQRVMIAMALACEPELLIADEPTTALDVTIQAQILDLLKSLQERLGLSIILITHDLGVVAQLCHRVAVMYGGMIVETGPAPALFGEPRHPYTWGLLRSTPRIDDMRDRLVSIEGAPPNLIRPPEGCAFHPRCPKADVKCRTQPPTEVAGPGRTVACWHPGAPEEPATGPIPVIPLSEGRARRVQS